MTRADLTYGAIGDDDLAALAVFVGHLRPDWPSPVVAGVLMAHRDQADAGDLAVAAIRAAQNPEYRTPKVIGWRGPHWDGARRKPNQADYYRCGICGKPEDRCTMERIGRDDDHAFEPTKHLVRERAR